VGDDDGNSNTFWGFVFGIVPGFVEWVGRFTPRPQPSPKKVELLELPGVVSYFTKKTPKDQEVAKGALMRQRHPSGYMVQQFFLDNHDDVCTDDNNRPYGRSMIVRTLSDELEAKFGDNDLIIFS
jgi:hypothetical protein